MGETSYHCDKDAHRHGDEDATPALLSGKIGEAHLRWSRFQSDGMFSRINPDEQEGKFDCDNCKRCSLI
ncbi:hypothetical protein Y032_0473g2099 [Ancylostoma ceylanicum]|nr:hypothetical protein Y032_0473g2099 [Ancylostoma ceylanicum]